MTSHQENKFYYWEDFEAGQSIMTPSYTISEKEIIEFAKQYDPQRFHVDQEEAQNTIFKGLIASGWQTASLMMKMVCDAFIINSSSQGSPGLDSLKWLKPVRPGDVLRTKVEILETRPMNSKPNLGLIRTRWTCLNQHDEITTEIESWAMYGKRPAGEVK
jgi:acyl dehydratase